MRLVDFLDKGASLGAGAPCLTTQGKDLSYGDVQRLSYRIARGLANSGISPGEKIAILSGNDPIAFACVFGISRAGAVWCPINPRNEAAENQFMLDAIDCSLLLFHSSFAPMVDRIRPNLPKLRKLVCLDADVSFAAPFEHWLADVADQAFQRDPIDDLALIPGTGGTTGKPKGVMLSGRNIETMTALTLMGYPFKSRPTLSCIRPANACCRCTVFSYHDARRQSGDHATSRRRGIPQSDRTLPGHAYFPSANRYLHAVGSSEARKRYLSSLQCFWYGAAPISVARLTEALRRIGPMAQLFGQTEAPMMISMMPPEDHYNPDGSIASGRLSSAGRVAPLVQVGIMDDKGNLKPTGERGEIVVRGSLVMDGYYKDPKATEEASLHGWHHTGDIGYVDADNFLYIVDRAKDMIIMAASTSIPSKWRTPFRHTKPFRIAPSSACRMRSGANALWLWCSRE